MNNQTHPILPNSNGTRTEPPKNAGPPARIKRRKEEDVHQTGNGRIRVIVTSLKRKKKSLARIEKKKDKIPRTRS
jgi:hypothetical protein